MEWETTRDCMSTFLQYDWILLRHFSSYRVAVREELTQRKGARQSSSVDKSILDSYISKIHMPSKINGVHFNSDVIGSPKHFMPWVPLQPCTNRSFDAGFLHRGWMGLPHLLFLVSFKSDMFAMFSCHRKASSSPSTRTPKLSKGRPPVCHITNAPSAVQKKSRVVAMRKDPCSIINLIDCPLSTSVGVWAMRKYFCGL
uniref:Uncharacterized protein n=1 Tax=Grammatophora oceanica TaxID=210454 RepID=A0A7S1Y676_9STRA